MKATGIVRRIDDLGRIVVPKEIRRTLRIKESDPMEIYTSSDGEIMLRKYSPIGELGSLVIDYADSLSRITGELVCITDREMVVAVSGIGKNNYEKKLISKDLDMFIDNRESKYFFSDERISIVEEEIQGEKEREEAISTIICKGDVVGSVSLILSENKKLDDESAMLLVRTAADFIGNHIC